MKIQPGSAIKVEVTAAPTNAAARKTLVRLFGKDAGVARHQRQQQAKRPSWERWRRGGKMWHHQMKTEPIVRVAVGRAYTIRATVDVLRDLAAVERFVKVSAG
jgi:hypothetical protein